MVLLSVKNCEKVKEKLDKLFSGFLFCVRVEAQFNDIFGRVSNHCQTSFVFHLQILSFSTSNSVNIPKHVQYFVDEKTLK